MRSLQKLLVLPLACVLLTSTSALAQEHVIDQSVLATAVTARVAAEEADRAAIRGALAKPQVRDVATRVGLDLKRAEAAVATMTGSDLERAATAAREVNDSLAGGASTIVLSTTTIIIALLVVIIILIAD
jgi:hypothetical protein